MSQVARCIALTALFVTSAAMAAEPSVQASQGVSAGTQQSAAAKRTAKRPQAVRTAAQTKVAAAAPEADFTLHWYN